MMDIAVYTLTSVLHDAKKVDASTKEFLESLHILEMLKDDDYSDFGLGARKNSDKAILSAFSEAGYDLSSVDDLIPFFLKYARILTTDINRIEEWQPGDIVFFDDKSGIISDKRNKNGVAFVICDEGEKDLLSDAKILFHFRFDMSAVSLKIF